MARHDDQGHPIKDFRIAEIQWGGMPLFVLWTMDEEGVWVLPGGSRTRTDMRVLGETIQEVGSFWSPRMAERLALLRASGIDLVDLSDDDQDEISAALVAQLPSGGLA